VSGTKSASDTEFLAALDQAVSAVSAVGLGLPTWKKELEELAPRGLSLESNLEAAFVGTGRSKRDEIRENLTDAQKMMGLMGTRLKELEGSGAELSEAFTAAFPAPAPAPPAPPEPVAAEPDAKPKPRVRGAGRAPSAKAVPKPAAETGDAPKPSKPAPGTAKPDFEP
jgi:hypothetical protein